MKPLTKEEFLERENSKIHKEILDAFESVKNNQAIARWFRQFFKDNPKLQLCQFMGRPKVDLDVNYNYQCVFINMLQMLENKEIVFREKPEIILSHDPVEKAGDNRMNLDHLK